MLALLAAVATVGCAQHAEPSPPVPDTARWVIAGPVAFAARHRAVTTRRGSVFKKAGMSVDAGPPVTLRVLSPRAGIVYRRAVRLAPRWQDADRVLRVTPCDPDHPRFSGDGTVGPRTGFPGNFVTDRRTCVRVRVSRGGRSWVARVPVGRACGDGSSRCAARPIGTSWGPPSPATNAPIARTCSR